ncbi:hybrid sensor histidine kinase/response regulator [Oscillatoria acuminata]|uniref:histidine kinase n=1 Tax=Oscillatoria acuminata PCC 6304 TaxID=56110 RepID=K9TMF6_9CYAN|nr:response regulator [Oscillatoria acuminata]AFY83593.1 histidine kinase,Response regulator receiver domain protein,histidine kinase [Oscillatoria acuminata PCC 6304]
MNYALGELTTSRQSQNNRPNILVVDDTPDNVRLLSSVLTDNGYRVCKALKGDMALTVCKNAVPDLILLDVMMPGMDGYEVCKCLKQQETTRQIPVIFLSALNEVDDKVKAFEAGGVDYISKPFQEAEVLSRVQTHLKLRQLQINLQEKNLCLEQEITERQNAQRSLEVSEAKNMALVNAIPDVMFRIGEDGFFLDYRSPSLGCLDDIPESPGNQRGNPLQKSRDFTQNIFPISESLAADSSFVGKHIQEVLSDDLAIWIMHYVQQTLVTSKIQIGEYVQRDKNQERWVSYEVRFVKSGPSEVLAIARDISSRKQADAARLQAEAIMRHQKQKIEQALTELQDAQVQLVQNEKMVGLGQLVAGIAHEINNPVNFIYGNISHVQSAIADLVNLLETYQKEHPPNQTVREILEELDFDFLSKDLRKMTSSIAVGAERINQIVLSLRKFSLMDESGVKKVDIHENLDTALILLKHRFKITETHEIELIKDYGEIPQILCYPGELNQVFFNLLNNAIDVLSDILPDRLKVQEANPTAPKFVPSIWISTALTNSQTLLIRIKDNGPGINESGRSRLFDPFFTTKPVGKGRGLGLSISYQIVVQKHGGQLTCNSTPGEGAEFVIELPLVQSTADPVGLS